MPSRRSEAFDWLTRLKAVEREYKTARLAVDRLQQQAQENPEVLPADLRYRDVGTVAERLEGTYVVRLFSEFETALKHFLRAANVRVPGKAEPLINRVRDRADISRDDAKNAHIVREYRNTLVHDRLEPVTGVPIRDATKHLGVFLGWLQRYW